MLFNSWQFLVFFFPIVLLVALKLRGQSLLYWIAFSSYLFYALFGEWWFLIPMLATTAVDFYIAPLIQNARSIGMRKTWLVISLSLNLSLLMYFKYSFLMIQSLQQAAQKLGWPSLDGSLVSLFHVLLPAGISFYTFQTMSYVIDVYRKNAEAEKNFAKFASFVSFFPHLVAGPLTRHNQLLPALERISEKGIRPFWTSGIYLFCVGLIKKALIADRIAVLIDPLIDHSAFGHFAGWACLFGYSAQIYFDFSGYSDMAIGLGRLFSVELPQNFNNPYQALNPSDFWRRWHMTLSNWLKDYLYIPLGGNRFSKERQFMALMVTMFLGGLWHGAQWTFAIWGLYHGLLLVLYRLFKTSWDRLPAALSKIMTFVLISLGWVFFRAASFTQAHHWFKALMGGSVPLSDANLSDTLPTKLLGYLILSAIILSTPAVASQYKAFDEWSAPVHIGFALTVFTALLFMTYTTSFLYFRF